MCSKAITRGAVVTALDKAWLGSVWATCNFTSEVLHSSPIQLTMVLQRLWRAVHGEETVFLARADVWICLISWKVINHQLNILTYPWQFLARIAAIFLVPCVSHGVPRRATAWRSALRLLPRFGQRKRREGRPCVAEWCPGDVQHTQRREQRERCRVLMERPDTWTRRTSDVNSHYSSKWILIFSVSQTHF